MNVNILGNISAEPPFWEWKETDGASYLAELILLNSECTNNSEAKKAKPRKGYYTSQSERKYTV